MMGYVVGNIRVAAVAVSLVRLLPLLLLCARARARWRSAPPRSPCRCRIRTPCRLNAEPPLVAAALLVAAGASSRRRRRPVLQHSSCRMTRSALFSAQGATSRFRNCRSSEGLGCVANAPFAPLHACLGVLRRLCSTPVLLFARPGHPAGGSGRRGARRPLPCGTPLLVDSNALSSVLKRSGICPRKRSIFGTGPPRGGHAAGGGRGLQPAARRRRDDAPAARQEGRRAEPRADGAAAVTHAAYCGRRHIVFTVNGDLRGVT